MSHAADPELRKLNHLADELREVFAERGYRIDQALSTDRAFGSRRSVSALTRDLALHAVGRACGATGVDFRSVNGEGRELRFNLGVDRRYRVLRGYRNKAGELRVSVNSDSSITVENEGMFATEPWAFVMVIDNDAHLVAEVVAAEIIGRTEGSPGHLIFEREILLGRRDGDPGGPGRFSPTDDDLKDFFEEDEDGDVFGTSTG